ncbi:MAG: glycosyl hydrolase, partial [Ferruginibacter sp.]
RDVALVAVTAKGTISRDSVIELTKYMQPDGRLEWDAPAGNWSIYRFGHTTSGTYMQPAQWQTTPLECDKMSEAAVSFHMDHIIGEIQKHLGDLIGTGFTHVHFDSYEAGTAKWTPKMREEFLTRRGYDLITYLPMFAGRKIGDKKDSVKFASDFDATIKDLFRDVYFKIISEKLKAAHLTFLAEPYGGPWRQDEVMPMVHNVMTEFWTHGGKYAPYELVPTVAALRKSGQNIIEAEAFTGDPSDSRWDETPEWLKPIGDAAFCDGVNRFIVHRFVEQAFDDRYKPGATMGRWGTHLDRTQTWWKPAKAMVSYWQRCQALLQWGRIAKPVKSDFESQTEDSITIKNIHRNMGITDIYFVANTSRNTGTANCTFKVSGMQPELWDPVTATMRLLQNFKNENGITSLQLDFEKAQSFFIVFRNPVTKKAVSNDKNFPSIQTVSTLTGPWKVRFDSIWGGPAKQVTFNTLQDWTNNPISGIKYFSGTAVYTKLFDLSKVKKYESNTPLYLDLGIVKCIAHVYLNGKDLGIVWTAPWQVKIPAGLLKDKNNKLIIDVTNVWANRLIGDEQEPEDCEWIPGYISGGYSLKEFPDWFLKKEPRPSKGRYCFTTWKYFTKDSQLISSGLLGPVTIRQ